MFATIANITILFRSTSLSQEEVEINCVQDDDAAITRKRTKAHARVLMDKLANTYCCTYKQHLESRKAGSCSTSGRLQPHLFFWNLDI